MKEHKPETRMRRFICAVKEERYGKAPMPPEKDLEPLHLEIDKYVKVVGDKVLFDCSMCSQIEKRYVIKTVKQLGYKPDWAQNYKW